jgi:predicted nucleic acid-binding protein
VSLHCLDTSAWVEITHDGPNAAKFSKALAKADHIIVSTISIYEISRYITRIADEDATAKVLAFLHQYNSSPVTAEIAELAAILGPKHKLAMADALIYATTLTQKATLWTQDSDFDGLPHVKYFPKIKKS